MTIISRAARVVWSIVKAFIFRDIHQITLQWHVRRAIFFCPIFLMNSNFQQTIIFLNFISLEIKTKLPHSLPCQPFWRDASQVEKQTTAAILEPMSDSSSYDLSQPTNLSLKRARKVYAGGLIPPCFNMSDQKIFLSGNNEKFRTTKKSKLVEAYDKETKAGEDSLSFV